MNTNVFEAEKAAFAAYEAAYNKAAAASAAVGIDAHEREVMRSYEAACDAAKKAYDAASYAAYMADEAFRRG